MKLTGHEALEFARQLDANVIGHDVIICCYSDPISTGQDDITLELAEEIAAEDPNLIYIPVKETQFGSSLYLNEHAAMLDALHWVAYGVDLPDSADLYDHTADAHEEITDNARALAAHGSYHAWRIASMDADELFELLDDVHANIDD